MAKKGTLTVRVISDTKAAERGLQQFGSKVQQTGSKMEDAGKKMTMFATVPIVGAMTLATTAAANLEQAVGGTEAVFGDLSGRIAEVAKTAPRAMGLTEQQFREATTSIGGQLKRMTGDVDYAADRSIELTQVAADLAATYGGTTAEAVQALGAAFRGEADPAERFNLNLKIGAVNAKAVEMGLAATTSEVSEAARAQATYALIMEQSADAQGQFVREQNTASGSMAIARAEIEQAAAELGTHLLPIVSKVAGGVADVAQAFGSLPEPVQTGVLALAGIVAVAGPMMTGLSKVRAAAKGASGAFETMRLRSMYLKDSLGPRGLTGALGVAGAGIAMLAYSFQESRTRAAEAEARVAAWTQAVRDAGDVASGTSVYLRDLINEHGDLAIAMANAGVTLEEFQSAMSAGGDAWEDMTRKIAENSNFDGLSVDVLTGELAKMRDEMQEVESRFKAGDEVIGDLGGTAGDTAGSVGEMGAELSSAEREMEALESASKRLTDAFNILNGTQMGVDQAAIRFTDDLAKLSAGFVDNGATLDINTEAGRANQEQIMSAIDSAQRHAAAMIENGSSVEDATIATLEHVDALKASMRQAGFTEAEIDALIARYNLTPDRVTTSVELLRAEEAERKLNEIARQRRAQIVAQVSNAAFGWVPGWPRNHAGGRAQEGVPRLIGRPGHEELFVPDASGFIHSGIATEAMRAAASGAASAAATSVVENHYHVAVNGTFIGTDSDKASRDLVALLNKAEKMGIR